MRPSRIPTRTQSPTRTITLTPDVATLTPTIPYGHDVTPTPQPFVGDVATFTYDGDGKMVKSIIDGVVTLYVSPNYQKKGDVVTKYYPGGAFRVGDELHYPFTDHLGSTSVTVNEDITEITEMRYKAWGEVRYTNDDTLPTDRTYTGQRSYANDFGLMFYNARWYDPMLGRFAQADTIIPGGAQGYDHYAYGSNNPIRNIDPTGHADCSTIDYPAAKKACEDTEKNNSTPPDTTDDSWGNRPKASRFTEIQTFMSYYQGEKWWSGSYPTDIEWAKFLTLEEGSAILTNSGDKNLLAWITLYLVKKSGPEEFTPATNPVIDPTYFELMNFTQNDFNALFSPDQKNFKEASDLVDEALSLGKQDDLPPYLYWVSEEEMNRSGTTLSDYVYSWHQAPTVDGSFMVFLAAVEDFNMAIP